MDETRALSLAKTRLLINMAKGNGLFDLRDWAILLFCYFTGARIATGYKLR